MTIRFVTAWNGYHGQQVVSGLGSTEEARLISLGFATADLDGPDNSPVPAFTSTDLSGNTVLRGGGEESFKLFSGETVAVGGVAFSVPTGYTSQGAPSSATPLSITATIIDTDGTLADLANDYVNVSATATRVRVSANVVFASNATGLRYIAIEQYLAASGVWLPVTGLYAECLALSGIPTPLNLNATFSVASPASFPMMRVAVGQTSGGALNCTPIGASFEFMAF